MNYIFNGNLKGFYCEGCYDYLYKSRVRIYAIDRVDEAASFAVVRENEALHPESDNELSSPSKRLLSETETDELGNFTINLPDTLKYNGGAFEINFDCGSVPVYFGARKAGKLHDVPVTFYATALQPLWKKVPESGQTVSAYWEYRITNEFCW